MPYCVFNCSKFFTCFVSINSFNLSTIALPIPGKSLISFEDDNLFNCLI